MPLPRCIWLDGSTRKAWRVLRARLRPFGYRIVCKSEVPDDVIEWLSRARGCVVATSDSKAARRFGWILVPNWYIERKSARDLATYLIKLLHLNSRRSGADEPRGRAVQPGRTRRPHGSPSRLGRM